VTTSSVVGLLNHSAGPYTVSKMAVTAIVEQFYLELQTDHAEAAKHVSVHMLHPTAAGTGFFDRKGADGKKQGNQFGDDATNQKVIDAVAAKSMDAVGIVDGLLKGMRDGKFYCVVDAEQDSPTDASIRMRMEDQMSGQAPRRPPTLGLMGVVMETLAPAAVTAEGTAGTTRLGDFRRNRL
jgi:short-subunit dehydrogenase